MPRPGKTGEVDLDSSDAGCLARLQRIFKSLLTFIKAAMKANVLAYRVVFLERDSASIWQCFNPSLDGSQACDGHPVQLLGDNI